MSTTTISSSPPFSLPIRHNSSSSRVSLFNPTLSSRFPLQSFTLSINKWRVLCFKHQNIPSESNDSEFKEDKLSQDSVKFKGDEPKDLKKKDWLTALHTIINTVLSVEPWKVPWTAKTIVQVLGLFRF